MGRPPALIIVHNPSITEPALDREAGLKENTPAPGLRRREIFGAIEAQPKVFNLNSK
jgi:hypothetical protein